MTSPVIDFLLQRKSAPIDNLAEPAPSETEIETMIRIASRVPDHGRLAPWRFILYRGDVRRVIGERLAALAEKLEGPLPETRLAKERARFARAPLVIGVVSVDRPHAVIPEWERFLSGGAAAMNLLLAANALGYGANWISNWYSENEEAKRMLGLTEGERVIGFVHVGSFSGDIPERPRPDVATLYSDYSGPVA